MFCFSFVCYGDHRDLHLLTHSFPTRRSSDRRAPAALAEHRLRRREAGGVGALETEDRLFRIADGEDRPLALARTLPGEELADLGIHDRSEEHTYELQSLLRISYAVFCLKKKKLRKLHPYDNDPHVNYT